MRKLTENQKDVLSCLTNEFQALKDIKISFAETTRKKGFNPSPYVWSSKVSRCLQSLIVKGLVVWGEGGFYALKSMKVKINE